MLTCRRAAYSGEYPPAPVVSAPGRGLRRARARAHANPFAARLRLRRVWAVRSARSCCAQARCASRRSRCFTTPMDVRCSPARAARTCCCSLMPEVRCIPAPSALFRQPLRDCPAPAHALPGASPQRQVGQRSFAAGSARWHAYCRRGTRVVRGASSLVSRRTDVSGAGRAARPSTCTAEQCSRQLTCRGRADAHGLVRGGVRQRAVQGAGRRPAERHAPGRDVPASAGDRCERLVGPGCRPQG